MLQNGPDIQKIKYHIKYSPMAFQNSHKANNNNSRPYETIVNKQTEYVSRFSEWLEKKADRESKMKTIKLPFLPAGCGTSKNVACHSGKTKSVKPVLAKSAKHPVQAIPSPSKKTFNRKLSSGNSKSSNPENDNALKEQCTVRSSLFKNDNKSEAVKCVVMVEKSRRNPDAVVVQSSRKSPPQSNKKTHANHNGPTVTLVRDMTGKQKINNQEQNSLNNVKEIMKTPKNIEFNSYGIISSSTQNDNLKNNKTAHLWPDDISPILSDTNNNQRRVHPICTIANSDTIRPNTLKPSLKQQQSSNKINDGGSKSDGKNFAQPLNSSVAAITLSRANHMDKVKYLKSQHKSSNCQIDGILKSSINNNCNGENPEKIKTNETNKENRLLGKSNMQQNLNMQTLTTNNGQMLLIDKNVPKITKKVNVERALIQLNRWVNISD